MIKEATNKLLKQEQIVEVELKEVFEEIFSGLANEVQTTSFLTALNNSNLSNEIISCAIEIASQSIKKVFNIPYNDNLMENIVLKKDENIFDISLIQDLICSSAELNVSRYSFHDSLTANQSFNILKKLGVNLEKEINYNDIEFEKLNFSYFYLSRENPYYKYSESIRTNLAFDNIFDITKKMLNPLNAKNIFIGVNKKDLVEKYANICLKLQKNNSIIVYGENSIPFISPSGESYIAEAWKNKIFTYVVTPELLGFNEYEIEKITCENNEENANDILEIINNKKQGAKYEATILNSALSLYITKKADSIINGIDLAKKLINDGVVLEKFKQIKQFYS
ncbi:MAG: hypothetical protein IKU37_10415 [Candidatus Gastranaerophilales bacterium]|nr:hypothetical protein [Candidatus Gastranaerophilales bacterium]